MLLSDDYPELDPYKVDKDDFKSLLNYIITDRNIALKVMAEKIGMEEVQGMMCLTDMVGWMMWYYEEFLPSKKEYNANL